MYYGEKKIIRLSMIVLFLSLMIVYILLYNLKGDTLKQTIPQRTTGDIRIINKKTQQEMPVTINNQDIQQEEINQENELNMEIDTNTKTGISIDTGIEITYNQTSTGTNIVGFQQQASTGKTQIEIEKNDIGSGKTNNTGLIILSGTQLYYGPLESTEKLGLTYQYILKDTKDIYYVRLYNTGYDIATTVRQLNGSIYIINTEEELLKNMLFGNKVTYINLPEYEEKVVLMMVEMNNQKWFIHIGYPIYHESKGYLKNLFTD